MFDLVLAPDPIYKTVCAPVKVVDDVVRDTLERMMQTCRGYHALGIAAPMVGLTQRLVVISLEDDEHVMHEYKMVNPVITERSDDMSMMEEGSISFLGITVPVNRPKSVTVQYLDEHGAQQTITASGILAVCLQHELDYLDGKTIIDHVPPMKRDMLKRKMEKQRRLGPIPHIHGAHCNHG